MRTSEVADNIDKQVVYMLEVSRVLGINPTFLLPDDVMGCVKTNKVSGRLRAELYKRINRHE